MQCSNVHNRGGVLQHAMDGELEMHVGGHEHPRRQ